MAQIIASIERMEQEQRRPHADGEQDAGRAQEPHSGRGKKSKKGKGAKAKAGKKLRVSAALPTREPFESKLTPKKRWIQLWSAQLDSIKEKDAADEEDKPEPQEVQKQPGETPEPASEPAVTSSPVSEAKVAPKRLVVEGPPHSTGKHEAVPAPPAAPVMPEKVAPPTPVAVQDSKSQEYQVTELQKQVAATTPKAVVGAAAASSDLRVKTPQNSESSHLSPPLGRNSPSTTASISPSAKVKDSEAPNTASAAVTAAATAAKFSPAKATQETPAATEKKEQPLQASASPPRLERKASSSSSSKGDDGLRKDASDHHHDRGRKRSLEPSEPMSEEAKRRAERRRKRKSNWDVGDPRKGGSPVAIPDKTAASAAANQQSFAKYPPNRPSWRHSQSMLDMKPHFQSGHRSSFYNGGSTPGRRGFYHSNSMPLDRSRSAGRSSTRYPSYGGNSYR